MGRGFEKRKRIILDYLQSNPEIRVTELMELTGAAVATVRRDLLELERQKLIVRTFGGVRAMDQKSLVDRTFEQRANCQAAEKHRIAVAAAKLVKPGMTIAIDSGTTCMNLAAMLKNKAPLRVITAALAVIETLGGIPGIEINLVGGQFRVANLDFYGTISINTFKQFHADIAFMSCDGLLPEFGAFSHDQESAAISQALIACASKRVLMCDSRKIGQSGAFLVFSPEQIDCLVTDRRNAELDERGYNCLIAGE